jgi:hypothetical protein
MRKTVSRTRAQNALRHGLYASDILLPWESESEFMSLYESVRVDLGPEGSHEEEEVLNIARLQWLRRRLIRAGQLPFHHDPLADELAEAGKQGWAGIQKCLRAQLVQEKKLPQLAREFLKGALSAVHQLAKTIKEEKSTPQEQIQKCLSLMESFNRAAEISSGVLKIYGSEDLEQEMFDRGYRPAELERMLKLEAMLDARYEKAINRLFALKQVGKSHRQAALPSS